MGLKRSHTEVLDSRERPAPFLESALNKYVGTIAHIDSGKTSLVKALLRYFSAFQSPVAVTIEAKPQGLSRGEFLAEMSRYLETGGWSKKDAEHDAQMVLNDFLSSSSIRYGDQGYAWDKQAAIVLINEWYC